MSNSMQLSILDYSPVDEGLLASDALAATVRLAQHAENKGFSRYWVSEHHGMPAACHRPP
jgi:alkanesulfonate monooxygenase SsuD/methylene tetrahydromethanopterin reductase-like flavin-dependent oxidoreductase (luciferase family)